MRGGRGRRQGTTVVAAMVVVWLPLGLTMWELGTVELIGIGDKGKLGHVHLGEKRGLQQGGCLGSRIRVL